MRSDIGTSLHAVGDVAIGAVNGVIGDYLHRREIYSPDRLAIVDAGKSPAWRFTRARNDQSLGPA